MDCYEAKHLMVSLDELLFEDGEKLDLHLENCDDCLCLYNHCKEVV